MGASTTGGGAAAGAGSRVERIVDGRRRSARNLLRVARLLREVPRPVLAAVACSEALRTGLSTARTVVVGLLVGRTPAAIRDGLQSPAGGRLVQAMVMFGALLLAENIAEACGDTALSVVGRRVDGSVRSRIRRAGLAPDGIAHVERPEYLDHIQAASGAVIGTTLGQAAQSLLAIASRYLMILSMVAIVMRFSALVGLTLFAVILIARAQFRVHGMATGYVWMQNMASFRRATYVGDLASRPVAAKEARIFGLASFLIERRERTWLEGMAHIWRSRRQISISYSMICLALTVAYLIALGSMVRAGLSGAITLAALTTYTTASQRLLSGTWVGDSAPLEYAPSHLDALDEIERLSADDAAALVGKTQVSADAPREGICVEDLHFTYPGASRPVFDGLDLRIEPGTSLAIVGLNGAGKTTLMKLLAGLYEPTSGRITVDGADLRAVDVRSWRRRLAVIFQDFVNYQMSAADNVSFGAIERAGDRELLERATDQAGVREMIDALPNGWDTILSRSFRDGTDLSGGQWQRLALARALFAVGAGATVLVLDEPTANLDVRAEAELFERFLELTAGLTTILISHRFSTVRRAQRIVVLDAGRVLEAGTHDELVAAGGAYAQLFALQAARFTPSPDEPAVEDGDVDALMETLEEEGTLVALTTTRDRAPDHGDA